MKIARSYRDGYQAGLNGDPVPGSVSANYARGFKYGWRARMERMCAGGAA